MNHCLARTEPQRAVISICMHRAQWIIKTTAPVSLSLPFHDFIQDCSTRPPFSRLSSLTRITHTNNKKGAEKTYTVSLVHAHTWTIMLGVSCSVYYLINMNLPLYIFRCVWSLPF